MDRSFLFSLFTIAIALVLSGCAPDEAALRTLVRDELRKAPSRENFSSAQVIGPYSPAIRIGGFLFLSGQIALDPVTLSMVGDNIESQTHQVFSNIRALLESNGYQLSDIVQSTVYVRNMSEFPRMNAVYSTYFEQGSYPTRTTVEVSNLPKNALIEIAVTAFKPGTISR